MHHLFSLLFIVQVLTPFFKKETADDTKRFCGFAIFVLKSSFLMVLRAFFIFMPFPRIASATTAGAGITSTPPTIVQALNHSGNILFYELACINTLVIIAKLFYCFNHFKMLLFSYWCYVTHINRLITADYCVTCFITRRTSMRLTLPFKYSLSIASSFTNA